MFSFNSYIFSQRMNLFLIIFFLAITFQLVQCDTNGSSEAANKSSMKCYVCSSVEDSDCANDPALAKFIMNCDDYFSNKSETFTATDKDYFCRKTVEMGDTFKPEGILQRVIRSCGSIRNQNRECYRTSDAQVKTETCECYDPLCNTADRLASSSTFLIILIPAISAIFFNLLS
ncbi:uncharacterized protein LOC107361827 [Tetranychus urticae]|uniref:uncharacterized protein LOC107361827 n=1 Tax=Tetranychus urticae TaxID=32264 RepID=UPI00077BC996|nr:uncharacterized protein LOC107361827 [Tetranychus urticae]